MTKDGFERMLAQTLKQDASLGTEAFRDALLTRCLAVLNADEEGTELTDEQLDMLSAAGDPNMVGCHIPELSSRPLDSI